MSVGAFANICLSHCPSLFFSSSSTQHCAVCSHGSNLVIVSGDCTLMMVYMQLLMKVLSLGQILLTVLLVLEFKMLILVLSIIMQIFQTLARLMNAYQALWFITSTSSSVSPSRLQRFPRQQNDSASSRPVRVVLLIMLWFVFFLCILLFALWILNSYCQNEWKKNEKRLNSHETRF